VGGTIVRALVDTGASQSLVDPRLVKQLDLEREGLGWIVGIQTVPMQVPLVTVRGGAIGRCALKPFKTVFVVRRYCAFDSCVSGFASVYYSRYISFSRRWGRQCAPTNDSSLAVASHGSIARSAHKETWQL